MDHDDDFWTTHIATTAKEDKDFRGVGVYLAWAVLAVVALTTLGTIIARLF